MGLRWIDDPEPEIPVPKWLVDSVYAEVASRFKVTRYERSPLAHGADFVAATDPSMSNDIPGILGMAKRQAALPPPMPAAPAPERVAPQGVLRQFGFDHRMGSGGTHGLG